MWAFILEGCGVPENFLLTPLRREASTSQNILGNNDVTLKRGREWMRSIPDRAMRGIWSATALHSAWGKGSCCSPPTLLFYDLAAEDKSESHLHTMECVQVILEGAYGRVAKLTISLESIFTQLISLESPTQNTGKCCELFPRSTVG